MARRRHLTVSVDQGAHSGGGVEAIVSVAPPRLDEWVVVNDDVMGGRSHGGAGVEDGHLVFSGTLNTRGGGFASVRSRSLGRSLAPFTGLALRVKGDGRSYACDLRESARVQGFGVTWKAMFETRAGEWLQLALPFSTFEPTWRGGSLRNRGVPLDTAFHASAQSVGFTIADKRDGAFRLDVAAIGAY